MLGMESALQLGRHSGRHALWAHVERLGLEISEPQRERFVARFADLARRRRRINDADLRRLAAEL